jgi:hypothetical protein
MWGFTPEEQRVLARATSNIPHLRAVIDRAVPRPDLAPDLLLVQASFDELDELYSLVEALMDGTRSTRRLELLDGLLASLCSSLDGF